MPYTARQLIIKSYYLSGIVSRALQNVTGAQISDGLDLLNFILNTKSADNGHISYYKSVDITCIPGQEEYFIDKLISPENLTFYINSVRFSMQYVPRNKYFSSPRIENIKSLPYSWHFERALGGANIYIYFTPNSNYPMTLWGKFGLDEVTLDTDLSSAFDGFYIEYLRYSLASQICSEYNNTFPQQSKEKLKQLETKLLDVSPPDFTMKKISSFGESVPMNYGVANLGTGWYP